jgi:hypothetical protein
MIRGGHRYRRPEVFGGLLNPFVISGDDQMGKRLAFAGGLENMLQEGLSGEEV